MFSVYEGLLYTVLRFFSMCFTITGVKKIVCFAADLSYIEVHRVVIKSWGPGIFPGYFYWKIEEK